jgi:glycosyltransferase involved in cell wall biosynthesis
MADRVCSVSESVQTQLIGLGWAQANNSQTILNGVDTIGFSPSAKRREEMRKSFGFERNTMVCICVARIATVKNHRALVAGFGKLLSRSADVALLIVGDGPLYSEIRNMIVQDGLEKHITMLGERSDVLDLLRLSDVFVLISLTEGLSVALLEAMSVGVVPVVTDVGGNSEIIDSKQYGILLGNDVTGSLVGALQELSDDPERRKRMSVAARLRVEQAFNITATADRYLGTYGISGLQGNSTC